MEGDSGDHGLDEDEARATSATLGGVSDLVGDVAVGDRRREIDPLVDRQGVRLGRVLAHPDGRIGSATTTSAHLRTTPGRSSAHSVEGANGAS